MAKSAAGVAFMHGDEMLVLQRSESVSEAGTWALPGGLLEPGETFLEAAIREVDEEILNSPKNYLVTGEYAFRNPSMNYSMFVSHLDTKFTPVLNYEHKSYRWVKFPQLQRMNLHPGFRAGLKQIQEMKNAVS